MLRSLLLLLSCLSCFAAVTPENLRCEYQTNPLIVDAAHPRLSWTLASPERAQRQTAYRILVASSEAALTRGEGDLWDTGKVDSTLTIHVEYAGKPLASHQRCFWKVMSWDRDGKPGAWSPAAEWSMGVLRPEDWKADWIALSRAPLSRPMPRFRKQFTLSKPVRRAIVYSSAGGFHELYVNGAKAGDDVLSPLWTNYRKSVLYVAHDITAQLRPGANVLAAELGNGFYNVPGGRYVKFTGSFGTPTLIILARIEYTDGSIETVGSNGSWKVTPGPTTFSCIHGGEDFDARLDSPGWTSPGFDDSKWRSAASDGSPGGDLVAQSAAPIKVMQSYKSIGVTEPAPGVRVYDLGQNMAGWPRIKVRGKAGSSIRMATAELLDSQGRLDTRSATGSASGPSISFTYTLKGEGVEEWHPKFSYTGFRYVEVTGDAEVVSMEADFIHNSTPRSGSFTSSSPLFNRINVLVDNAVRSNFQGVLTDCPHREKLGWLEETHLMGPSVLSNFDAANFYAKLARDIREAQLDNGLVPDIAPEYVVFRGGFRDSPEWGSAVAEIPWLLYTWFGDTSVLRQNYPAIARYAAYLESLSKDDLLTHGLGDWYDIGPGGPGASKLTPRGITATGFRYRVLRILEEAANVLAKPDDEKRYAASAARVKARFNEAFFDQTKGYYGTGSQAAQAIPLVFGIAPESERSRILAQLTSDIRSRGDQQTAGDIGYRFLIRGLTDAGRSDLLYAMNARTNAPSYGAQIERGVTSLAEAWDANPTQSQNHFMLGHIQEWFVTGLAGINQAPGSIAFEKILIKPTVVGNLTSVEAHYDSIRGRIATRWRLDGQTLRLDATIPANTTATIVVPASAPDRVTESGQPARSAPGLRFTGMNDGAAVFEAGSGRYAFVSTGVSPARP